MVHFQFWSVFAHPVNILNEVLNSSKESGCQGQELCHAGLCVLLTRSLLCHHACFIVPCGNICSFSFCECLLSPLPPVNKECLVPSPLSTSWCESVYSIEQSTVVLAGMCGKSAPRDAMNPKTYSCSVLFSNLCTSSKACLGCI